MDDQSSNDPNVTQDPSVEPATTSPNGNNEQTLDDSLVDLEQGFPEPSDSLEESVEPTAEPTDDRLGETPAAPDDGALDDENLLDGFEPDDSAGGGDTGSSLNAAAVVGGSAGGNRRTLILIGLAAVLLITLIGAAWFFFLRPTTSTSKPPTNDEPIPPADAPLTSPTPIATETHLECRFGLCVEVPGAGDNLCSSSFDCEQAATTPTPALTGTINTTTTPNPTTPTPTTGVGAPLATATPTVAPTSAPTPTLAPTSIPTTTPTPLVSQLPESGTTENTIMFALLTLGLIGMGIVLSRPSRLS